MRVYELMIIFDSDLDDSGIQGHLNRVTEMIEAGGGRIATTDRWGRRKFAYEINHKLEGYYVVIELLTEAAGLPEVERHLRIADDVVRHLVIRLPDGEAVRRGLIEGRRPAEPPDDMAIGNSIDLTGNLTRDPELRYTPGGMAVATFGLAVNRRRQNRQSGEWEESTSFFDVVSYGSLAENVSESLGRGARVVVVGRLEQRSWETPDGDRRSKIEVIADEIGPSLRWATADVTKNDRRSGDGGAGGGGGGSGRPVPNEPPAYDYDEEPF